MKDTLNTNPYRAVDFSEREKRYILVEFPYPSGSGLHVGHAFSFIAADIYSRYLRMQGKNVLFPMGWDAFGLPTENYAIKTGQKPQLVTQQNTETFKRQMHELGLSFDWEREINTTDPSYYKWTQWIFIKLWEKGLAYKTEMPINWCPSCKVGLANEEVVDGKCERCGAETTRRRISQWVVKITAYADRLIEGLNKTDFIDKVRAAQINWIGRSSGASVKFPLKDNGEPLEIFTTRPDTLWGATFMVIAPEHPLVEKILDNAEVAQYVEEARKKSELERTELSREKTGVFSGLMAINPCTGREIPIWISDFVLATYGTGAIMAVPAHDERDHAFAKKFNLPIVPVIEAPAAWDYNEAAYVGYEGKSINSGVISGLPTAEAIPAAIRWLEEQGLGKESVSYHLRDWIFSRQHYWGEPIPMIYCQDCGWNPVPETDLPVVLPEVEAYQPTDTGESPLAAIESWVKTTCPRCGKPARRETDTMPNWAGSDWYFLRYCDPHNDHALADMEKLRYWMPVDVYIGGDEHNTLHLLYSRFIYQFLHDIGAVPPEIPEPYQVRLSHGVILGPDGQRMSKSRGNVIVPDSYVEKYGADALRAYMMFIGPFDATMAWNERAFMGVRRFLDRFNAFVTGCKGKYADTDPAMKRIIHKLIKAVGEDLSSFKFNTAVAKMMEALNDLQDINGAVSDADLRDLVKTTAPIIPFMAEELWKLLGGEGTVHAHMWAEYDPELVLDILIEIPIQVNGKLRGKLEISRDASEEEVRQQASQIESVARFLQRGEVIKVIYRKGQLINFVVRES